MSFGLMSPNLRFFGANRCVFGRRRVGERKMMHVWFPPWSMEEVVWWCFLLLFLVTLSDLFRIQGTLNQYGYHRILQRYAIPSGLRLVGLSFVFQQDNDPKHTPRVCKGCLTKKESDGVLHRKTWPPHSPDLNPIEMVWDELERRVKENQPTSAQHMWELQDLWKSIPCEACGYFEESQIYLDLLNTFLVTTWFHMCYYKVLMSSLLF